jgi:hypothetical protein
MLGFNISPEAHDIQSAVDLDTHISENPPPDQPQEAAAQ